MTVDERPDSLGTFKAFSIAEGILLIVLGILALIFPVIASFWTTGVIAVLFLVGGVVGWISNLARSGRMGRWVCFWRLVVSTLFLVAGGSMISNFRDPVEAAEQVATFALAIGIVFLVEGLVAFFNGLRSHQPTGCRLGHRQRCDHLRAGSADRDLEVLGSVVGARNPRGNQFPVQWSGTDHLQLHPA